MYDKLICYCHFGNGDIFESIEFAKEYIEKIPAKEYFYAHGKPKYILENIHPKLQQTEVTDIMDMRKAWFVDNNCLYINMWIGRDGRYVLPGIGCTVEMLYQMHNDILRDMNLQSLEKPVYAYIPSMQTLSEHGYGFNKPNQVFISNGPVQSNQAENFDFSQVIQILCENFPEYTFIITSKVEFSYPNLVDASTWNLWELAETSTYCKTIIGRSSGPQVFAQNLDNWMDREKACLSFTYERSGSHFVYNDILPMKKYWSPATDPNDVYAKIVEVINR